MRPPADRRETASLAADPLAELLKRRGATEVHYFHADHYEPWGGGRGLSDKSLRGVENFQRQTRSSPYGSKLSLFYSPHLVHDLDLGAKDDGESRRAPNDGVVFRRRSEQQDRQVSDVIRPLVTESAHEMHLHVHHEWWTRNHSHLDNVVSKWVNAHSTNELDQARLDLFFSLATSMIANETGASFDRWGFVHGNWALAGSDPQICQIENELSMIMRHGGFGDFTFPAGRSICDPRMEVPFTCLPLDVQRAYDLPEAQPTPVGRNSRIMQPDRFFIWNSRIKANYASLDYYSVSNRDRFKQTEFMVENWLSNSVVIENCLFIKTHAHSMYKDYNLSEPDSLIPHCYPDTVAIFERLARACDRADVELKLVTVNEVMELLHSIDGTAVPTALMAPAPSQPLARPANLLPPLQDTLAAPAATYFGISLGSALAVSECDEMLREGNLPLSDAEQEIVRYVVQNFKPVDTALVQGSAGGHSVSLALTIAGFDTLAFEPEPPALEALRRAADTLARFAPGLTERLKLIAGGYLDDFKVGSTPSGKKSLLLASGMEGEAAREMQLASVAVFDDAIVGFGPLEIRSPDGKPAVLARLDKLHDFVHRLSIRPEGEMWHMRPSRILGANKLPAALGAPAARRGAPLKVDIADFDGELVKMQEDWIDGEGKKLPPDDSYAARVEGKTILLKHERAIAEILASIFDAAETEITEIGSGCGGLSLLLARHGFAVRGYEGDRRRFPVGVSNLERQSARHPELQKRLSYVPGFFPEAATLRHRRPGGRTVCVITNVTHSYTAQNQDLLLRTASMFDELILDLGRFGINRDGQDERDRLRDELAGTYYEPLELLYKQGSYEYWRLRVRHPERPSVEAAPERAIVDPPPAEPDRPEPEAVHRQPAPLQLFPLRSDKGVLFSIYGDRHLSRCPVCEGSDTMDLWRIPMSRLPEPLSIFGGSFTQLPTRETPAPIACYDFCRSCHTVFLNPVPANSKERFRRSTYFVTKMAKESEWRGYERIFDLFAPAIPEGAKVMLDAACGVGQYLRLAQKRSPGRWKRLIGLDLSNGYVEDMRRHGIEAHAFDLDSDDIDKVVGQDQVDFITFCEAVEQVDHPLRVLRKLVRVLKPRGRLFFTAQRYGSDARGPVRPAEQIYLGAKGIEQLTLRLGCRVVGMSDSNMRYYVTLER